MGRQNTGADLQSAQMGGDVIGYTGTTTSAPTATTAADTGAAWTTNAFAGHAVVIGGVIGHILSNTATVLTVDMWHTPTYPLLAVSGGTFAGETVGTTPASGVYVILTGNVPAFYMGLSTSSSVSTTHTFLDNGSGAVSELWASGGGLNRSRCSYSHTTSATNYVLSKTQQMVAADGSSLTLQKGGWFQHQVTAAVTSTTSGRMFLETAIPSPPTLIPGDSVAITETVNI